MVNFKKQKNFFGNFQISEKDLVSLSKGNVNHEKILGHFDLSEKVISLEMNNIKIINLKNEIKIFKNLISKITNCYS